MSKFISHLKTVLPRNFADRSWSPMVNGQRSKIPAHWEFLVPVEGAFVKSDVEMQPEAFRPPTPAENPIWVCIKSQCEEGGLMEFEDFWNPPQPPNGSGDNNGNNGRDSSDLPTSGTGGTGWYENTQIAETTQNQGGQGGTGVQGIGLDLEKNKISVLEKPFLENPTEEKLTSISEGGQGDYKVDSCDVTQDTPNYEDYPHLYCDNIDVKRNQAEDIKERLLKAQTKQDLTLIREEYSERCDWVWKNLLSKAQRRALKEVTTITQLDLLSAAAHFETKFEKADRVMTPQGEGKILYFNESWGEYNVAFEFGTQYFKPQELALIVPNKFNSVDDEEILEAF
jgi:hypothetical protein